MAALVLALTVSSSCAGSAVVSPAAGQDVPSTSTSPSGRDVIGADFYAYTDEMAPFGDRMRAVNATYRAAVGENFQNDGTLYRALLVVRPRQEKINADLAGIHPATPEVRALHQLLQEGSRLKNHGFVTLMAALEAQDPYLLSLANNDMDDAVDREAEFAAAFDALRARYPALPSSGVASRPRLASQAHMA